MEKPSGLWYACHMLDNKTFREIQRRTREAVAHYWATRTAQQTKQADSGQADQGLRSAVTGGAQMDGFVELFADLVTDSGLSTECLHRKKKLQLPGFFRPTKEWDLLVIRDGTLIAAIEAKSQVGPSFGNNFNNRTEEAMGSALDLWTAFREGAFMRAGDHTRQELRRVIRLVEAGRVDISGSVSHVFAFSELEEAMELVESRRENVIRAVVRMDS